MMINIKEAQQLIFFVVVFSIYMFIYILYSSVRAQM